MNKYIYFDHAATTPLEPLVFKAMRPYFKTIFANPNSLHSPGQKANQGLEKARRQAANFLNCSEAEIYFTSGATESINLALQGVALKRKNNFGHIITTAIEHPAVLETVKALESKGFKVTYLPVNNKGLINEKVFKKAIRKETFLVSLMYINNETGARQPIEKIGAIIKSNNKSRKNKIIFHTDAVQAAALFPLAVDKLGVDTLSLSAHKIYGPKGVGLLYLKKNLNLKPIIFGGHHENGVRPGTLNTPLIVGLGEALEMVRKKRKKDYKKLFNFSQKIIKEVKINIKGAIFNGDLLKRSPGHINFTFDNIEGESLLLMLDKEGLAVSTGSACASASLKSSHVLKAMGLSESRCHGAIRISLGRHNTKEEVEKFLRVLPNLIKKIRARSPQK
ncbi:MAG: cysteine desulfurase family protein [Patescibacteria group bacterium]|nr:cysteine desulfurase family protein [Patescibacteria group bacterium]